MKGIYCYIDSKTGLIDYIGQSIDLERRFREHLRPSKYDAQPFNRILQNNPNRYEYRVLCSGEYSDLQLNKLERLFIKIFTPRFNFNKGGGGNSGYKHTEEALLKISKINSRDDLDDDILAKEYFDNGLTTYEIGEKYNCNHETVSRRLKKNGHQLRDYSEYYNTSGYFRVIKQKCKTCKKGFTFRYQYTENGKRKTIYSVDINKLEEKVKNKGLEWRKV